MLLIGQDANEQLLDGKSEQGINGRHLLTVAVFFFWADWVDSTKRIRTQPGLDRANSA